MSMADKVRCRVCGKEIGRLGIRSHALMHRRQFDDLVDGIDGMTCPYGLVFYFFNMDQAPASTREYLEKHMNESAQSFLEAQ